MSIQTQNNYFRIITFRVSRQGDHLSHNMTTLTRALLPLCRDSSCRVVMVIRLSAIVSVKIILSVISNSSASIYHKGAIRCFHCLSKYFFNYRYQQQDSNILHRCIASKYLGPYMYLRDCIFFDTNLHIDRITELFIQQLQLSVRGQLYVIYAHKM